MGMTQEGCSGTLHDAETFIPYTVRGKKWQKHDTEEIANAIDFFQFKPGEKWHSFEGYGENQYFVDPNKFMLTTPGISPETGDYEDFGVPAAILANYLREHRIIPEKNDLNSILFLLTPAETPEKLKHLVDVLVEFETVVKEDAPLSTALPDLYRPIRNGISAIPSDACARKCTITISATTRKHCRKNCSGQDICRRWQCRRSRPTGSSFAIMPSLYGWTTSLARSRWKAPCRIRRAYTVSFRRAME
jgi:hypothetical protein